MRERDALVLMMPAREAREAKHTPNKKRIRVRVVDVDVQDEVRRRQQRAAAAVAGDRVDVVARDRLSQQARHRDELIELDLTC